MYWLEIETSKKISSISIVVSDQNISLSSSSSSLLSIWLKNSEKEVKLSIEMCLTDEKNLKEEITLPLPLDYKNERTCVVSPVTLKLRRTRSVLPKDCGYIYDLLCNIPGSISFQLKRESNSSSNHGKPLNGTNISRIFDDFKIKKSNDDDVPLDIVAIASNEEDSKADEENMLTCFAMIRESAARMLLNRPVPKDIPSVKHGATPPLYCFRCTRLGVFDKTCMCSTLSSRKMLRTRSIPLESKVIEDVVLSSKEFETFCVTKLEHLVKSSDKYVRCASTTCKAMIERVPCQDDLKAPPATTFTKHGLISGDALKHFNRFRIRCLECSTTFCSKCGVTPYHIGKTCEQNAKGDGFEETNQCRFCETKLQDCTSKDDEKKLVTDRTLKDVQKELSEAMKKMDRVAISRLMLERAQMQQSGTTSQKAPSLAPKVYSDDMSILNLRGYQNFVCVDSRESISSEEERDDTEMMRQSIYAAFTFETWIKPRPLKHFSLDEAEDEEQVDSIMSGNAQLDNLNRYRGLSVIFSKGGLLWNEMNPPSHHHNDDEKKEEEEEMSFDDSPPPVPGMCVLYDPMKREIKARIVSVTFIDGSLPKINITEISAKLDKKKMMRWVHVACTYSSQSRNFTLYIDGENMITKKTQHKGSIGPQNVLKKMCITLGGSYVGHFYSGYMSETRLWSCVRTPQEINRFAHVRVQGPNSKMYGVWPMSYCPDVNGTISMEVEDRSGHNRHGLVVNAGNFAPLKAEPRVDTNLSGTLGKQFIEDHAEFFTDRAGKDVKVSNDRRSVTKSKKNWNTGSALVGPAVSSGIVRWRWLVQQGTKTTVGIVVSSFNPHTDGYINKTDLGYAYYQENGKSGHNGPARASYGRDWKDPSCIIDVILDCENRTLSFSRNGVSQGIAFKDLPRKPFLAGVSLYNAGDSVRLLCFERLRPRRTPFPIKMISRAWKGRLEKQAHSYLRCSRGALLSKECFLLRMLLHLIGGIAFLYLDGFLARGIDSVRRLRNLVTTERNKLQDMGVRRAHARMLIRAVEEKKDKKDVKDILLQNLAHVVDTNVWMMCEDPPIFADHCNKKVIARQDESLRRLAEDLERQRILDLEAKAIARKKRLAQQKNIVQLVRMGFPRPACKKAIQEAGPAIETAAEWLVNNMASSPSSLFFPSEIVSSSAIELASEEDHDAETTKTFSSIDDENKNWRCSRCTFSNQTFHKRCAICNMASREEIHKEEEGNEIVTNWFCGICQFQNRAAALRCEFCNAERSYEEKNILPDEKITIIGDTKEVNEEEEEVDVEDTNANTCIYIKSPRVLSTLSMCCDKAECIERRLHSCPRRLECGHLCGGIRGTYFLS